MKNKIIATVLILGIAFFSNITLLPGGYESEHIASDRGDIIP